LKYFEKLGVKFKLERGGRYFPRSDNAGEIAAALLNKVHSLNIAIACNCEVTGIARSQGETLTVAFKRNDSGKSKNAPCFKIKADKVILATGGKSYPGTGSNGSGYELASSLGHSIMPLSPSLVPVETKGDIAKKLQGLSLKNVSVSVWSNNKKVTDMFGEMLFADFGVTGPIILTLSKEIVKRVKEKQNVFITIDLKPALDHHKIDQRLLREVKECNKQSFKSLLKRLLPRKLIPVFIEKLKIAEDKRLNQLSSSDRKRLKMLLKEFRLDVKGFRSFDQAIVTSGGVKTNEINSHTMESKLVKGLYFAGEVIDVDADTGGFNLQAAFSTGWIAGRSVR
jgi:predicted Rossmann fold flavoprotein